MAMYWSRAVFTLGIVLLAACMVVNYDVASAVPPRPRGPNTTVVKKECGAQPIPQKSQFWSNLGLLLSQLAEITPYADKDPKTGNYYFKTRTGGFKDPAFGEATCKGSISVDFCKKCLTKLRDDIWGQCNSVLEAHVEYVDCGIRYSNKSF